MVWGSGNGLRRFLFLGLLFPSLVWATPTDPPQEDSIQPETREQTSATDEDEESPSEAPNGVIRFMCKETLPLEVLWQGTSHSTWSGDSLHVPAGASNLRVSAHGYIPREGKIQISNSQVTSIDYVLEPIPDYEWMTTSGWIGVGLGLVLSIGAIAVEDTVDFDTPVHKNAIQWSFLGTGSALLFTGSLLVKEAHSLESQTAPRAF
jgi:hypothetical protein